MRIWVDTSTGDYGSVTSLRIVEVSEETLRKWEDIRTRSEVVHHALLNGTAVRDVQS